MEERSPLHGLFRFVVSHPVAVSMVFIAMLVFGYVSFERLPIELMPDIAYPTVTVRTGYEGAAPQEVESQISRPVEEALATLDGLVQIESRSRAGSSDVILGFDWGTDMGAAAQRIRESMQVTFMPPNADRPLILRYDPSLDPFLRLALSIDPDAEVEGGVLPSGDAALFMLRDIGGTELKRELEGLKGVAAVRVLGGLEPEITIHVREDWLSARQVTLDQVRTALTSENINVAGGSIIEGDVEYLIRTLNEYTTLKELESLRIRRADGVLIPITDVAELAEAHKERQVVSRLNGGEAVELEVFKEADANVVDVAERVGKLLNGDGIPAEWGGSPGIRGSLPEGVSLTVLDNQAAFIEDAVSNLRDTALLGGVFAVGVLFLFLRDFRATAIVGAAIPMSIMIGFAPLYLNGITLNLMSLGGLALGVGMLVDNGVVVLESIQRWREQGLGRADAAVRGTADVSAAVIASTMTTVAVFLPISFVEGVAGELFGDLSVAVVSSLMASLLVALFAVPTMAAFELNIGGNLSENATMKHLTDSDALSWGAWLKGLVMVPLRGSLVEPRAEFSAFWTWRKDRLWRWIFVPYAVLRFLAHLGFQVAAVGMSIAIALSARFVIRVLRVGVTPFAGLALWAADRFQGVYGLFERRYVVVLRNLLTKPGSVLGLAGLLLLVSVGMADWLGTELIPELHQGRFTAELHLPVGTPLKRTSLVVSDAESIVKDHPEVAVVYSTVGVDRRADSRSDEGEHTARLRVQLTPGGDLAAREARVMEDLRASLSELPRMKVKMVRPALFSFRTPVEVVLYGWELDELREVGDQVAERLSQVDGLRDVRSSLVSGHPEVRINYDRARLHRLGLDAATVAGKVRDKIQGVDATEIHQGEHRIALKVQLVEQDRGTLADLRQINVNPNLTPVIPLDAVADFEEAIGPSEIRRVDQQRAVVVSANLEGFDLGSAGNDIGGALVNLDLPDTIRWSIAGQSKEMSESLGSLQFALGLAIFLVYVIMASTFENIIHPLVILFSVPLAVVGAVGGLVLSGSPISVVVFIGLIVLAGVVVNNAIVLVDTINRERETGKSRDDAIRSASAMRLRPILITTATTVLGLAPLAFGFGAGAEMQGPLAVTVIGGLLSSTMLTLVVIPVVYRLMNPVTESAPEPALQPTEVVS